MSLSGFLKRNCKSTFLAGVLSLSSCGNESVLNKLINYLDDYQYQIATVRALRSRDDEFQPEIEDIIEKNFNVNILGEPESLTDEILEITYDTLSFFRPEQVSGLNIVLGNDGGKNFDFAGQYRPIGIYSPIVFIDPLKFDQFGFNYYFDPEYFKVGLRHEIFHHLHLTHPNKINFDREWFDVRTKIISNGEIKEVTTLEAIKLLDRRDIYNWRIFDSEGNERIFENGLFGFVRPYALGTKEETLIGYNLEDVSTFSELIDLEESINPNLDRGIAYWDPVFDVRPYLEKIGLLNKYGFIDDITAQTMSTSMVEKDQAFFDLRSPDFFKNLEEKLSSLEDPQNLGTVRVDFYFDDSENPYKANFHYSLSSRTEFTGDYLIDSNDTFDDILKVSISASPYENPDFQRTIEVLLGRKYKKVTGGDLSDVLLVDYEGHVYPNNPIITFNTSPTIYLDYSTTPVNSSSFEQKFSELMQSQAWQNEFRRLMN